MSVKIHTNGYGGGVLKKTLSVETSDPARPRIQLKVSGRVEKFIRIAPPRLRMQGLPGMPLQQTARIILTKKYPVKLLEAHARDGRNLDVVLKKMPGNDPGEYRLTVKAQHPKPGRYYDTVVITTDSPLRPTIAVGVFANITPAKAGPES